MSIFVQILHLFVMLFPLPLQTLINSNIFFFEKLNPNFFNTCLRRQTRTSLVHLVLVNVLLYAPSVRWIKTRILNKEKKFYLYFFDLYTENQSNFFEKEENPIKMTNSDRKLILFWSTRNIECQHLC